MFLDSALGFWDSVLDKLNSRSLTKVVQSTIVFSDASHVGCASFISINGSPVSHKNWSSVEMHQSSTWRELYAIFYGLKRFRLFFVIRPLSGTLTIRLFRILFSPAATKFIFRN